MIDKCTNFLDNGKEVDIVYTDFEKAFDKVPHQRLLSKLRSYALGCDVVSWIEAFLCSRVQNVKINGILSQPKPVLSGIPQGSVLGPLLFISFINDIPSVCDKLSEMFLFADDAKLYKCISSDLDHLSLIESCQNLMQRCELWCMKLNLEKCKVLTLFKTKPKYFVPVFNINYKG